MTVTYQHPLFVNNSNNNYYCTNYSTNNRFVSSSDQLNSKANHIINNSINLANESNENSQSVAAPKKMKKNKNERLSACLNNCLGYYYRGDFPHNARTNNHTRIIYDAAF